jgi:RNA polymerase sigma-70 factor (ECF subfamily)
VDAQAWQAEQFEGHRPHLVAIAYRMLGSLSEAEDAVQETWLRLSRSFGDPSGDPIGNMGGWLTTVVGRVCIDMLRARRSRREDYASTWLPEPIVSADDHSNPEQEAVLADTVGLALLVVLETLTPLERLAFVLHDTFGVPFEEIAPIIDRTPAAARQLASRARRRIRGSAPAPDADLATQREIVTAFLAASRDGDFDALIELLDPDIVFRADSGPGIPLAPPLITGAAGVARWALTGASRFAPMCRPALVNGAAGVVVHTPTGPLAVVGFTITHGRITSIDLVLDRDKLRAVDLDR